MVGALSPHHVIFDESIELPHYNFLKGSDPMIYDRFGQSIYTESDTQPDLHSIAKQLHDAWSKFTYGNNGKNT